MATSVPIREAYEGLALEREELTALSNNKNDVSFNGFPSRLSQQHAWLNYLSELTGKVILSLRKLDGCSLPQFFHGKELFLRLMYLKVLYNTLKESAGDLTQNKFALIYESNVLLLVKWVIFKNSDRKFKRFLTAVNEQF